MSIFSRIRGIAESNVTWLLSLEQAPEDELEAKEKELEQAVSDFRQVLDLCAGLDQQEAQVVADAFG